MRTKQTISLKQGHVLLGRSAGWSGTPKVCLSQGLPELDHSGSGGPVRAMRTGPPKGDLGGGRGPREACHARAGRSTSITWGPRASPVILPAPRFSESWVPRSVVPAVTALTASGGVSRNLGSVLAAGCSLRSASPRPWRAGPGPGRRRRRRRRCRRPPPARAGRLSVHGRLRDKERRAASPTGAQASVSPAALQVRGSA